MPGLLGTLVDCSQDGLAERWAATLHGDMQVGVNTQHESRHEHTSHVYSRAHGMSTFSDAVCPIAALALSPAVGTVA